MGELLEAVIEVVLLYMLVVNDAVLHTTRTARMIACPLTSYCRRNRRRALHIKRARIPMRTFAPVCSFARFSFSNERAIAVAIGRRVAGCAVAPLSLKLGTAMSNGGLSFSVRNSHCLVIGVGGLGRLTVTKSGLRARMPSDRKRKVCGVLSGPCGTSGGKGGPDAITVRATVSSTYHGNNKVMCIPTNLCCYNGLVLHDGMRVCVRKKTIVHKAKGPGSCVARCQGRSLRVSNA